MPRQDRSGTKYEKVLAFSLEALGFERNANTKKNYLQPPKNSEIVITGTYIQPDLVVRSEESIEAVLYSTHWSNTRSSKYKFWRTWEEQAQQRCVLGDNFLSVNCVFEALPAGYDPIIITRGDELPDDPNRVPARPIQLEGWDPGIGWALIESFDVNLVFPKAFGPIGKVSSYADGDHDTVTTGLLKKALSKSPKKYFATQWSAIRVIKTKAKKIRRGHPDTISRYRIGLLHIYLLVRLCEVHSGRKLPLKALINALAGVASQETELRKLNKLAPFDIFKAAELDNLVKALSGVYVRKGNNPEGFCTLKTFSLGGKQLVKVLFNKDLQLCVADLKEHLKDHSFEAAIHSSFTRFDRAFGVTEAVEDLADVSAVKKKAKFVEKELFPLVSDSVKLGGRLVGLQSSASKGRSRVSGHRQNWQFEILLNLCGLNSAEDVQTRFKALFEAKGHKLRPHAPFGDHAKAVAFMIQGRDLCELWSGTGRNRTLSEQEFRDLCWEVAAECLVDAIDDHGDSHSFRSVDEAITLYLQNKSMRIISSDLNGFYIMIEHFLGDLCHLQFLDAEEQDEGADEALKARVCASWQTDMVKAIWESAPLETWVEGVSKDGKWLIKVQSSQDGNEGHKTKELSGRSRAMHLKWTSAKGPANRVQWKFSLRRMPKTALVLDGDWSRTRKKNLYEAGWDWVGDVSELAELRKLIGEI